MHCKALKCTHHKDSIFKGEQMKKLPRKFQYPLMISMLFGMTAIMAFKTMPADTSFLAVWWDSISLVIPSALMLLAIVAPTVRLFVTKVLLEPDTSQKL